MAETFSISSGDSDVEITGAYHHRTTSADPLPLSDVKVDVEDDAVNVNHYVDLTDPRWCFPHLKLRKRHQSNFTPVIDLTESDEKDLEIENILPGCQIPQKSTALDTSNNQDLNQKQTSASDSTASAGAQGCVPTSQEEKQQQNSEARPRHLEPVVKLTRLPILESHAAELTTSRCSMELTKVCVQMPPCLREFSELTQAALSDFNLAALSKVDKTDPSISPGPPVIVSELEQDDNDKVTGTRLQTQESLHPQSRTEAGCSMGNAVTSLDSKCVEDKKSDGSSSMMVSSSTVSTSQDEQSSEVPQTHSSGHSSPRRPVRLFASELFSSDSMTGFTNVRSDVDPPPTWETQASERDLEEQSEAEMYCNTFENDNPLSIPWEEGSDGEDWSEERSFGGDFRAVKGDDLHYVCPVALKELMARPSHDHCDEDGDGVGAPEVLSRQRLSQVYTTIEVNYPEGTLEQLFDLLQPGYYLPGDVVAHLLHGILLSRQCSHHHRVQAFHLLMRTQRYHIADKTTVPWDWELLTSVMASQDNTEKHRSETVCMFLEYILQTLEDDFHANNCPSALHHSIAKATLSCNQRFSRVRDVIKWLFSVITKSTQCEDTLTRERDDYIRMVTVFQRMLSLALEVDGSPALSSAKLSLELFHTLISFIPLRAHRMLLLDTLQSKQLKCKLLEHLLDYACPVKIQDVPMSLSLLLHFLKNSTLAPDPSDGTERWKKWEELMQLFWMLLISYNKAMKGFLRSSNMDQRSKVSTLIYKAHDVITAAAVREAVEAFLSRSRADLGHKLPLHVEESLTYLQDHLLDACEHQQTQAV